MSNVRKLELVHVGEGFRFDGDELLEAAKGNEFDRLMIVGEYPDGSLWVSGTANAGETLILLEKAKRRLVFGDE